MSLGFAPRKHGALFNPEAPRGGGALTGVSASPFVGDGAHRTAAAASRFVPSLSESLLRTPAVDTQGSRGASAGATLARATVLPTGGVCVPGGPDLVERSAFLYGLLHSDHLVYDVHDAIVAVAAAAAAADPAEDDGGVAGGVGQPRQRKHIGGGTMLTGVFYFSAQPPWPDMPWRPTYKSAVLLCVFVSPAACQRAIARLSEAPVSVRSCGGAGAVQPLSTTSASPSTVPCGTYSARVVLRPASEYVLSPESVDTALLTFLTAPQLASLLLRRRHMQMPPERGAVSSVGERSSADQAENMLAFVRANPPSSRVSSSAVRLFAAILSPQSTFTVDWAAAQVAVNRGDGVVVPEMKVVEPWVSGWSFGERSDASLEFEGRGRIDPVDAGRAADSQRTDAARHPDARFSWDTQTNALPLTLQEEHYRRRYGVTPQGRQGGGGGSNYLDGGDRRSTLSRGVHSLLRGASWALSCVRESLGEREAPLVGGSSGSAGLYVPPPLSKSGPLPALTPGGTVAMHRGRAAEEPPLRRSRTEATACSTTGELRHGAATVIPRYNAVGTALSWIPGFQHFGQLFVTSTTVLTPQGATTAREPDQRSHRRRGREEQEEDAVENPAWESLVMQRYADASTAAPQRPLQAEPVQDSVLSWMSPGRGTGWSASSWPPQEKLQSVEAAPVSAEGQAAASSWRAARVAEVPAARRVGSSDLSGPYSLAASTIVPTAPSALPSHVHADVEETMSRRSEGAVPRRIIRVEKVRYSQGDRSERHASDRSDDSSFLFRYHRRHQIQKTESDRATDAAPAAPASETPTQAAPPRPSFPESLRKSTMDARGNADDAAAPHTPVGGNRRGVGFVDGGAGRPSLDTELPQRSSQRTVSFTLPDPKA